MQPSIDEYFMMMAVIVSLRSTCCRALVGAVLTKDGRVLGTGYNGAPSKLEHCTDVGCLIVNNHCIRTVHAEVNAVINCARHGVSTEGSVLYCTHFPCFDCMKMLINAGVMGIVYLNDYIDDRGDALCLAEKAGMKIKRSTLPTLSIAQLLNLKLENHS